MKDSMNAHIESTQAFLKEAFAVDGEVTTNAKECVVLQQDESKTFGITFVLNDSARGQFMVTISNPKLMKDDTKSEEV